VRLAGGSGAEGPKIWSIAEPSVMNAMIRMGPRHVGQASGSPSTICGRSAAHRRVAQAGASRGVDAIVGGITVDSAVPRILRGGWCTSRRTAW